MSEQILYRLIAENRDGDIVAQSTSMVDFDDVVSDSDNLQAEVNEYLDYGREEPDWDSVAKHERIMEEDLAS